LHNHGFKIVLKWFVDWHVSVTGLYTCDDSDSFYIHFVDDLQYLSIGRRSALRDELPQLGVGGVELWVCEDCAGVGALRKEERSISDDEQSDSKNEK
jgi:hypothetical protein